jgi:hypothetical protein
MASVVLELVLDADIVLELAMVVGPAASGVGLGVEVVVSNRD